MELHQIQMLYQVEQDRILLRVSFAEAGQPLHEICAWLTRRLIRNLWSGMVQALQIQVTLDQPQAVHAKAEVAQMAYQASAQKSRDDGSFSKPFDEKAQPYPEFSAEPILVSKIDLKVAANRPLGIKFSPSSGYEFEIALNREALHGFCALLRQTVAAAQWDIDTGGLDLFATRPDAGKRILN